MSSFQAKDRAVTIRTPSVAQLYIDSADRLNPIATTAEQTVIQKGQAIIPGFFNRVALTEFTFEWFTPNVSGSGGGLGNNTFYYAVGASNTSITIPTSFYTVSSLLNKTVALLNNASLGLTWTLSNVSSTTAEGVYLIPNSNANVTLTGTIMNQLGIAQTAFATTSNTGILVTYPDIRPCKYLDLTCPQLTYTQEVKDSSSQNISRDALARWYFSYNDTEPTAYDSLGFPILMGYKPFIARRTFSPAKQIKWETSLPVAGSLNFNLYNETGALMPLFSRATDFLITLQVSED